MQVKVTNSLGVVGTYETDLSLEDFTRLNYGGVDLAEYGVTVEVLGAEMNEPPVPEEPQGAEPGETPAPETETNAPEVPEAPVGE